MNRRAKDIVFTVLYLGEEIVLETFAGEYRNLMMLLSDKIYPDDFGECKGMGRCGTCVVEIIHGNGSLSDYERNESSTLTKLNQNSPGLRLACQIRIKEELNGIKIKLL